MKQDCQEEGGKIKERLTVSGQYNMKGNISIRKLRKTIYEKTTMTTMKV